MITISTNSDNDLYLDVNGNLAITKDINALSDVIKNKILTALGEAQFDVFAGIPYFETVFTDTPLIDLFQASIIETIEKTDGVNRVSDFEYTQNNGVLSYVATVETIYGDIQING